MKDILYDRIKAVEYAHKWAFSRNPRFYDFSKIGGDCTNFCSQCLYSGSNVMNYSENFSWFYNSIYSRSPSWTGVQYLYNFLVTNKGVGPYGHECDINNVMIGDIIQLSFDGVKYNHSLVAVAIEGTTNDKIYIATHSYDSDNRPLDTYTYKHIRYIHIDGVRKY